MGGEAHHGKKRGNFVQRTIDALAEAMERSLYAEQLASSRGILQNLDPRIKLIGTLLLIATAASAHTITVVIALAVVTFGLALLSRISLRTLSPIWIGMFVFSGMIGLPALFLVPGPILATIPWLGWQISATGLRSAAFLILRSEISITLSFILITTTQWTHVLKSLRIFGIPTLIVVILSMTYRYIFLMLQSASDMFEARQSRVIGKLPDNEARRLAAATVGVLLSKSFQLSNDVFMAMQSRGFRGEVYILDEFTLRRNDYIAIPVILLICGVGFWFNYITA